MRRNRGELFVVSAPSGAGKTTLCQKLTSMVPNIRHSVSYTTRKPRPGEVNDVHYTFVDEASFRAMADSGQFAEWAEVHGNLYGTSRRRLDEALQGGSDVILDVDVQGARSLRAAYPDGVFVFILPPSMEALRQRLRYRSSDPEDEIDRRLKRAAEEIRDFENYNYVIVNNVFEDALKELEAVVISRRLRVESVDPGWVRKNLLGQEEV